MKRFERYETGLKVNGYEGNLTVKWNNYGAKKEKGWGVHLWVKGHSSQRVNLKNKVFVEIEEAVLAATKYMRELPRKCSKKIYLSRDEVPHNRKKGNRKIFIYEDLSFRECVFTALLVYKLKEREIDLILKPKDFSWRSGSYNIGFPGRGISYGNMEYSDHQRGDLLEYAVKLDWRDGFCNECGSTTPPPHIGLCTCCSAYVYPYAPNKSVVLTSQTVLKEAKELFQAKRILDAVKSIVILLEEDEG